MGVNHAKAESTYKLLNELLAVLRKQNELNWSRGVKAAAQELVNANGDITDAGFENARSIYNTMVAGGRGFAEYFIWSDNEDERILVNKALDDLRSRIWKNFNSYLSSSHLPRGAP